MEETYRSAGYQINPVILANALTERIFPKGTDSPYQTGTFNILVAALMNIDDFYDEELQNWDSLMTIFGFLSKPSLENMTLETFTDRGMRILKGKFSHIRDVFPEARCVPYYTKFFSMSSDKQKRIINRIQVTLLHLTDGIDVIVSKDVGVKEL